MKHFENSDYQTISNVAIANGNLNIEFMNNDKAVVSLGSLLPSISESDILNVTNEDIDVSPYEISINLKGTEKLIPWDKIRVLTDKDFSRFLAEKAEDQAKLIGIKIKRLREKKGIRSNDLAERSGISAQTISRIEKGHQDIGFTTLRKLLASMGYSLKDLANEEIELENEQTSLKTLPSLLKRLAKIGIDPSFVTKKIIPNTIQTQLNNYTNDQPDLLLDEAASYLSSIYGWSVREIWGKNELSIDQSTFSSALFKKGAKANINQVKAYVPYANYLVQTTIKATKTHKKHEYPEDIEEFKSTLSKSFGGLNLRSVLDYAWSMGICVLPLNDSGIFHGAAWNINGKHAIVIKQKVVSHAKWLFDLLHEIYHVLDHLAGFNDSIIEAVEISSDSKDDDPKEREANSFASQVIFNGSPEAYAQEAVALAKGKTENLRSSVVSISEKYNLRLDSFANYIAHRLAFQGNNWWHVAEGLQEKDPSPYSIAREVLLKNIDMEKLSSVDFNLLSNALNL